MAKFEVSGNIGLGFGVGSANGKKNWISKLVQKVTGKDQQAERQPGHESSSGEATAGLGGYGLQYNCSVELSIDEMRELYQLTHSDEEWSFGRTAAELKAIGNGLYKALAEFAHRGAEPWNRAVDTVIDIYKHAKDADTKSAFEDRKRNLSDLENRLAYERSDDALRKEDQRIRREEAEKEEKAKK